MMRHFSILVLIILLISCKKEEELLPGSFVTDFVGMADMVSEGGVDYQKQLYFDLSSGELKASNFRNAWDIALGCDLSNPNIYVNPAMNQSVAATGSTDFTAIYDPSDYKFEFERADRYHTSSWISRDLSAGQAQQEVFLIDLGNDFSNQSRGYVKLQVLTIEDKGYRILISDLDNQNTKEIYHELDPAYNFMFLSVDHPDSLLSLEPIKEDWDLQFTKYMERLYDGSDTLDYSVTGCMINPYQTTAYYDTISSLDSSISYASLRIEDVDIQQLSTKQNTIGHEWKRFDLDAGSFLVNSNMNFFIRDESGIIYRFRFTGFYNSSGQKGGVSFEYLPL